MSPLTASRLGFLSRLFVYLSFALFESASSLFSMILPFCPRVISFGPAAPSMYSRQDFGPSSYPFWASSAFDIFESGLRSLELSLSGQQRLRHVRVRAPVPRIISFGPAAPSTYSSQGTGPSNYLFRASSAIETFEAGFRSFERFLSTQ
jgi:hypothetical protein